MKKRYSHKFPLRYSRRIITFFIFLTMFLFVLINSGQCGVYDGSKEKYRSRIIDHSITPERVNIIENRIINSGGEDEVSKEKLKKFARGTIFWRGEVEKFVSRPGYFWIYMKPEKGRKFWILAKNSIRNLDFDRTGYTVGVKGSLILKDDSLYYVKARSIVLIAPPPDMSFAKFKSEYNLKEQFTMNTSQGQKTIRSKYYPFVLHRIYCHNPHYEWSEIKKVGKSIIYHCQRYKIDPVLLTALLNIESAFDMDAVSASGAIGLGQLMPGTASSLGVDPNNPSQNVGGAAKYLSYQLRRWRDYRNCIELSLASYNAGPGAVSRHGGIPPYSETKNYVFFITFLMNEYEKQLNEKLENDEHNE